jgi:hypothetical protein
MQSQHHTISARFVAWFMLLAMAVLAGSVRPAEAKNINKTLLEFGPVAYAPTNPNATSDITRIILKGTYEGKSLIQASSSLTITRTVNNKEVKIVVPVAASASSQAGGNMVAAKPGFISFGTAGSSTFQPGDMLTVKLTFTGDVAVSTTGGLWLDVDKDNTPSTNGSLKIKSQKAAFDTSYTISNDLNTVGFSDPLFPEPSFSDPTFAIQNLAFLGDITTGQLDALSLDSIAAGVTPSGATLASPSMFTLTSPLCSQGFTNPFPEPVGNLWDVALGQFIDPDTGATYAFIDAYQGAPEPSTVALMGSGILVLGLAGLLRGRGGAQRLA